jgi:hypothetical protein
MRRFLKWESCCKAAVVAAVVAAAFSRVINQMQASAFHLRPLHLSCELSSSFCAVCSYASRAEASKTQLKGLRAIFRRGVFLSS